MPEMTKQEQVKLKRENSKPVVRAKLVYECSCGHHAIVPVKPDEYGLINLPERYCGSCAKTNNFRLISYSITELIIRTKKEWEQIDQEKTDNVNARTKTTDLQEEKEKESGKVKGQG